VLVEHGREVEQGPGGRRDGDALVLVALVRRQRRALQRDAGPAVPRGAAISISAGSPSRTFHNTAADR
jgi:hypothetical protein